MPGKREQKSPVQDAAAKRPKRERRRSTDEQNGKKDHESPLGKAKTSALTVEAEKFCAKFTSPDDSIKWLLANAKMSVDEFFKTKWQKGPFPMHATEESKDLADIFGYDYLVRLIKSDDFEFSPEIDFAYGKYPGKCSMEEPLKEALTVKEVDRALGAGDSLELIQPHRFQPALHALLSPLETYFGSLVYSDGYICPPKGQFRGAHFIDEECFIVQTEGTQTWKIYENKEELSTNYSNDYEQDQIGEPIMTVKLKPGDILYLPRGTLKECAANETRSCYFVVRTYQRMYWANYFSETLTSLVNSLEQRYVDLRRGLPLGFLPHANITKNDFADYVTKLAEMVRADSKPLPTPTGMVVEFMSCRMPPYGVEFDLQTDPQPTDPSKKVKLRQRGHIAYYTRPAGPSNPDEAGDEEEDGPDGDNMDEDISTDDLELVVLSSVKNDLLKHGTPQIESSVEELVLDPDYEKVLDKLLNADKPVKISDLVVEGTDPDQKPLDPLILAQSLFNIGALVVVD